MRSGPISWAPAGRMTSVRYWKCAISEAKGDILIIWPKQLLLDGQSLLIEPFGLGVVTQAVMQPGQVVERQGCIEMWLAMCIPGQLQCTLCWNQGCLITASAEEFHHLIIEMFPLKLGSLRPSQPFCRLGRDVKRHQTDKQEGAEG